MIVDCNRLWTQLVSAVYRLRRRPMVSTPPPPNRRAAGGRAPAGADQVGAPAPSERTTAR